MLLHSAEMHINVLLNIGFLSSPFRLQQGKNTGSPAYILPNPQVRTSNMKKDSFKRTVYLF